MASSAVAERSRGLVPSAERAPEVRHIPGVGLGVEILFAIRDGELGMARSMRIREGNSFIGSHGLPSNHKMACKAHEMCRAAGAGVEYDVNPRLRPAHARLAVG